MKLKNKGIKTLGKLKVWETRVSSYIAIINFMMIFYLYIIQSPLNLRWYHWGLLISLSVTIILFIDTRYVFPSSLEYVFEKNPEMIKLRSKVDINSDKLDEILRRIK